MASEGQISALRVVLERLPGALEAMAARGLSVEDMLDGRELNFFGYGSLPAHPHFDRGGLKVHEAVLHGFERDFCCISVRNGTEHEPGRTLGLLPVSDGLQYGGMLSYTGLIPDEIIQCFENYQRREVGPDIPIYKFELAEAACADGKTRIGFVCVADRQSPGYMGDETLPERARAIATAYNEKHPALGYPVTAYNYFYSYGILPLKLHSAELSEAANSFEKLCASALAQEYDRFYALNDAILQIRAKMPGDQRRKLEEIEYNQAVTDYATQVKKAPDAPRTKASLEYVSSLAKSLGKRVAVVVAPLHLKS